MAAVAPAAQTRVPAAAPLLAVEGLDKVYPTGQRALAGVNVTIERPQVVAIIGSSGAGKSTFIRCINRLVEPTAGRILLHGQDVVTLDRRGLRAARRRIGMIFQEFNLVERLTVMQNVLSGRLGYVSLAASLRYRFPPRDDPRGVRAARSGRAQATTTSAPTRSRAGSASGWASRGR